MEDFFNQYVKDFLTDSMEKFWKKFPKDSLKESVHEEPLKNSGEVFIEINGRIFQPFCARFFLEIPWKNFGSNKRQIP